MSFFELQGSLPEKARENFCAWNAGRATLTELWAAMVAIFGAATRREEDIVMVFWWYEMELRGIVDGCDGKCVWSNG